MKKYSKTEAAVAELAKPVAEAAGVELWDVRFEKEGSMWILLIVIDKAGGVSIDDCETVSRALDALLDEADPIEQSYCLEVSSAGIERELHRDWHFEQYKGEAVVVRLIRPIDGQREFLGKLNGLSGSAVAIETENGEMSFEENSIAFVKLYVEF